MENKYVNRKLKKGGVVIPCQSTCDINNLLYYSKHWTVHLLKYINCL
jgi:hypothetical protein